MYTQSNWSTRWRASIHTVEFISAIYLFGFFFSFVRWLQYLQATPLRSSVMFPLICPQIRPIQKRQLKCNASDSMWIFFCQHQRKKWRYGTANVFSSAPNSFKSMLLLLWDFFLKGVSPQSECGNRLWDDILYLLPTTLFSSGSSQWRPAPLHSSPNLF